jgi:hypothetical protein
LALTIWPQCGLTQSDREFVFADEEGHLVVRFPGSGATGLNPSQADEILNAEFSSMVHDRLRADLLFEAEPRDADWAAWMEPQIEKHVKHAGPEFSDIFTECRAASCRVVMEQPVHWSVTQHRAVLEPVQESVEAFIAAHQQHFEAVFMITAYDQETETSHIKVFLRRAGHALGAGRRAG